MNRLSLAYTLIELASEITMFRKLRAYYSVLV